MHLFKNFKAKQDDSTSGEIYLKLHMVSQVQGWFRFAQCQNERQVVNEDTVTVKGYHLSYMTSYQGQVQVF